MPKACPYYQQSSATPSYYAEINPVLPDARMFLKDFCAKYTNYCTELRNFYYL